MKLYSLIILASMATFLSCNPLAPAKSELFLMDMVHHNPGEAMTLTKFSDPNVLKDYSYNGMVVNTFIPVHAAIAFQKLNPDIFPENCPERKWIDSVSVIIDRKIKECHDAGIKVYYFTDIIVLPKKVKELYYDEICNDAGQIDLHMPKTREIHRLMFQEVFERFPDLDGLVIRTGETYLHNMPYHCGNNPVLKGEESHIELLQILREEVCERLDKKIFYRTWDFGFFHINPEYYLNVTNRIEPHKNLIISVKHTKGDYHRTFPFNPTIGIGNHPQIIEVQCQREYEGKGAYPDYVIDGVINGFEENMDHEGMKGLNDFKDNPLFAGVWTWTRGGGWVGPYITNELWCDLNAYAMAKWTLDPSISQQDILFGFAKKIGLNEEDLKNFKELCLLSPKGVVRGRNSLVENVNVWWTRDQFLGGLDLLDTCFRKIISENLTREVLEEKKEARLIWERIYELANEINGSDPETIDYLRISSQYGLLKYSIIEQAWTIMLLGLEGDINGIYEKSKISDALRKYDQLWVEFRQLPQEHPCSATIYRPYSFNFHAEGYEDTSGMKPSVDKYRTIISKI